MVHSITLRLSLNAHRQTYTQR